MLATHAGGWCGDSANPHDLRSCDDGSEIFRLVRELPPGTVHAIVAGHTHGMVAHIVNDVPIISVPNFGVQFGRVDLTFDTSSRHVAGVRIHPPQRVCARIDSKSGDCTLAPAGVAVEYEGRAVAPSAKVAAAIAPELERIHALRAEPLGIADSAVARGSGAESALGNLFADAVRAAVPGAVAALGYGSGRGGLRADLPSRPADVRPCLRRVSVRQPHHACRAHRRTAAARDRGAAAVLDRRPPRLTGACGNSRGREL